MPQVHQRYGAPRPAAAALAWIMTMLMAHDALGLEAAMDLDPARGRPARFAPPAADQPLRLRRDEVFRSWQDRNPLPRADPAGEHSEGLFDNLGLADAIGFIGARSGFGLVARGVEYFFDRRRRDAPRQAASAADDADRPGAATDAAEQGSTQTDGVRGLLRDVDLTLGPVRWGAVLTDEYRLQKAADGQRSSGFVTTGNLNAASYLYQPWFAQLRGGIGFVRSSASGAEGKDDKSFGLTGNAGLSLFPASRFPFDASYSVSDSRASGEITASDYRNTRVALRQAYRTLDGSQFTARYERSVISGTAFGNDVLDVLDATYAKRFAAHAVELNASHSSNTGGINGTQSNLTSFYGRDSYAPADNLNLETFASYNQNRFEQNTPTLHNAFSTRFVQLASYGNWRPAEGEPLYDENHAIIITGAVRYSGIAGEIGATLTDSQSASANLGLNYTIGPVTRLSAGATATYTAAGSGASGGLFTSQSAALSHAPLPKPLGSFLYSWNASTGASNATGSGSGATGTEAGQPSSRQSVSAQAGHNLSRSFQLSPRSNLTFNAGQSAGANLATGAGSSQNIAHNATAYWSLSGETGAQAYVSLSASDSRSFGETRGSFQLINLQATRQAPAGPQSFWTANLTVQGTRQQLDSSVPGVTSSNSGGFNFTTTGSVTYQHLRAFGVPRLRFFASYTANQTQLQSRLLGDLGAPREAVSGALDARLDYQIGKVDARLSFRTANVDRKRISVLFLRVTRNF